MSHQNNLINVGYRLHFLQIFQILESGKNQMNTSSPIAEYFRYKFLILGLFFVGMFMAVFGPFFFPDTYYIICMVILGTYGFKSVIMAGILAHNYFKFRKQMGKCEAPEGEKLNSSTVHTFIIPNFKEDISILKQTITALGKHANAPSYCVMLAMEKHEEGCEQKAQRLVSEFKTLFRVMSYTIHQLQPGEAKSKCSNINWCTQFMVPKLIEKGIDMSEVFVTILDADSMVPALYTDQVTKHIQLNYQSRHKYIYQPPQIFTCNINEVSFIVSTMDSIMSYMHSSNLYSVFKYTMAVSNYTLSYKLLERIGFWDTCHYSRGEDVRITSKAYWKTGGETETVPIYAPVNQYSVSTGQGFVSDVKARFNQARRHCQCQIQASYNLVSLMKSKMTIRDFHVFFTVFELYYSVIFIPIPFLVLTLQNVLHILPKSSLDTNGYGIMFFNIINISTVYIGYLFYDSMKREASQKIYGVKNHPLPFSFLVPPIASIFAIAMGFIPMILAGFSLISNNFIYTVAPKNVNESEKQKDKNDHPANKNSQALKEMTMDNQTLNTEQSNIDQFSILLQKFATEAAKIQQKQQLK